MSYPASEDDINLLSDSPNAIVEFPIYTEMKPFYKFLSLIRIFRMVRAKFHKHKRNLAQKSTSQKQYINSKDNRKLSIRSFFTLSPWKMDFNQATGRQLIGAMKRIMKREVTDRDVVDVVLIGHSKSFIRHNSLTLSVFLRWAERQDDIVKYAPQK